MMRFDSIRESLTAFAQRLSKNRHLRYGAPFIGIILLGSGIVSKFAQLRYDTKRVKYITDADIEKIEKETGGKIRKSPEESRSPEAIHAEYMRKDYVDDYECVRGPRPWETEKESQWEANRQGNKRIKKVVKTKESYNI